MNKTEAIQRINTLAKQKEPFLFIIDYKMKNNVVIPLAKLNKNEIDFSIGETCTNINHKTPQLTKQPISFEDYSKAFFFVKDEIKKGNSYLTNLTGETKIETEVDLQTIYNCSEAKYKLLYKDEFVVFSPETFVKIQEGKISSYPMKGTIDASIENAEDVIINNKKEAAEHATITDLIRNDLSRVATNIKVNKYRYIDEIKTNESHLLQVSSEISGDLPEGYLNKLGTILFELLPAGSICGAPKSKTLDIINQAESYDRKYYTGVFGIFDGTNLDSAVMIRFIEKNENGLVFKSGGGITINSVLEEEYNELIKKVYLPF